MGRGKLNIDPPDVFRAMRYRRRQQAVSPVIATVMLVGLTLAAGTTLWTFRPALPAAPTGLYYEAVNSAGIPAWGDGSDCKNIGTPPQQTCLPLPAVQIVITSQSPQVIPVANLFLYFFCNGTIYLSASLVAMEWVPGFTGTPSAGAPKLGTCGTYVPPSAAFNRFGYFQQQSPGAKNLIDGDTLVFYSHTFFPTYCFGLPCWLTAAQHTALSTQAGANANGCPAPQYGSGPQPAANGTYQLVKCDDDFHGSPLWCYTVLNACEVLLYFSGSGVSASTVLTIPLYGLAH